MMVTILGSNSFIGINLFDQIGNQFCVNKCSLRDKGWNKEIRTTNVIINLVGKAHIHKGKGSQQDYYHANVDLAKEVFYEFIDSEARLLIHVSSLAALEEVESVRPLTESDNANPQSFYGRSKREAEEWLLKQTLPANKKLIILRPPMVHGVGDKGNLGLLYKLICKGMPYPLSSFDNQRSFISMDNFTFFIQEIIKNQDILQSGIYHISDDQPVSTKNIIEIIGRSEGKKIRLLSVPKSLIIFLARIGDVLKLPLNTQRLKKMTSNLIVSNQKIKNALKIENLPLSAEEGLIKTVKSFKSKR